MSKLPGMPDLCTTASERLLSALATILRDVGGEKIGKLECA